MWNRPWFDDFSLFWCGKALRQIKNRKENNKNLFLFEKRELTVCQYCAIMKNALLWCDVPICFYYTI